MASLYESWFRLWLFLVFRTSWLLWSQARLSKLVKAVLCHITEVFLCERAPSFTVVRPCYKRPTKAWLVCYTGVNSQSDCGSGTITSEVFDIGLAFIAGSLPEATSTVSAQTKTLAQTVGLGPKGRLHISVLYIHPAGVWDCPTESVHRIQLVHLHLSLAIWKI